MALKDHSGKHKNGKDKVKLDTALDATTTSDTLPSDPDPLPSVHVNKAHLGEIKSALDDVVKRYLEDVSFTPSLLHPTVHLTLGYSSCIFSLGAVLYCLKVSFEDSKPILWVGVIGYALLQSLLWAWKRWFEQGEIFRGKRRRMVKRIETDHVHITTSTSHLAPPSPAVTFSPLTRPTSPSSPISPATLSPSMSGSDLPSASASASVRPKPSSSSPSRPSGQVEDDESRGPTYLIHLFATTTSNNGKSLIRRARVVAGKRIGWLIDESGGVEEGVLTRWLGTMLTDAGLPGLEEDGVKEE